jgi:hypothetical protein
VFICSSCSRLTKRSVRDLSAIAASLTFAPVNDGVLGTYYT